MAADLQFTLSPNPVQEGQTVTLTYNVTGADPVPPSSRQIPVDGTATVDGVELDYDGVLNVTDPGHTPVVTYQAPTAAGMTWVATANPRVWTAVAPQV